MTVDSNKLIKSPEVDFDYIKKKESLCVTIELPGVKLDTYSLNIATCGFCVSDVVADNAEVNLKNGTLTIYAPFANPVCGKQFPIDSD